MKTPPVSGRTVFDGWKRGKRASFEKGEHPQWQRPCVAYILHGLRLSSYL